jgi:hypothetical protein
MRILLIYSLCFVTLVWAQSSYASEDNQLSDEAINNLAITFDKDFREGGAKGLWQKIQTCYSHASLAASKRPAIEECMILDKTGKGMDDAHVKKMAAKGANFPNEDWYIDDAFKKRIAAYAFTAAPDDVASFSNQFNSDLGRFYWALSKLTHQGS